MSKRERAALIVALILLDALAIVVVLIVAYNLRYSPHDLRRYAAYIRMTCLAVPIFLVINSYAGLYDVRLLFGGIQEYASVIRACSFGVIALTVLSFWERGGLLSRAWLLMAWIGSILLMGTGRFVFRRAIFYLRRRGLFISRTLVIGANEQAKEIARQLSSSAGRGVRVIGFLDDYLPPGTPVLDGLEVLGSPTELDRLALETGAGGAVVVPDALAWESFQEVMGRAASRLDGLEVKVSPSFNEILTTGVKVDSTNFVPLFSVERVRITGLDAVLKNLLDYGLSLVLLVLLAPLMAVIALALRWTQDSATSRPREAPILDRHLVQGLGGRSFLTLKFRTGSVGSIRRNLLEPLPAKLAGQGTKHDRLNSLLYRTGLDKLPQLFNVVRGQMSLVGPRTISDESGDLYGPWLPGVLTVKPGMTGPWAVYDVPSLDDEIRSAMYYIRNWTIWIDLQVLFSTARRVLQFTAVRGREMASEAVADPIHRGASARDSDVQPPHTPPPAGAGPDATSHGTRHTREADTVEGEWTQSKPI